MERKSSVKDVHQYIKQDYPELYKTLCSKLGESNPFAKFSIGAGNYVWSDNRCQWDRMIDASELKQSIIHDSLNQTKADVATKIGSKTAEALFTTPDNSYIYYNDDNGDVKILIAGWGFKKPVRIISGPDTSTVPLKNPVSISFSYDGERLKNYEFGLRLAKQVKRLSTDDGGLYVFDNLKIGENYIVTDINNNKDFQLNIIAGQSLYDFDVTRFTTLDVSARCDDQPIIGETVGITCHGKKYDITTDGNGHATIQLPLYDGEEVKAFMRDKEETIHISANDNHIDFIFEKEKNVVDIQVCVKKDGQAVAERLVAIDYGDFHFEGNTDPNGIYKCQMEEKPNVECKVSTPEYESQSKLLHVEDLNTFDFDKTTTHETDSFTPYILVKRENGEIVADYPISVEYDGSKNDYISDGNGIIKLPELEVGKTIIVTDGNDAENRTEYLLKKEEEEYVFIIPDEIEDESKDIKVMFRDMKGTPIVCNNVTFHQEGKPELSFQLDENGDAYIKEGTFDINKTIHASINGWTNKEQYSPIPFELEKDEYEYLLQEKEPQYKSTWWKIILEILAILISICLFIILWPIFEEFCSSFYNSFYN